MSSSREYVSTPAIERLCRRAGAPRVGGLTITYIRGLIDEQLLAVLNCATTFRDHAGKETTSVSDVLNGIEAATGVKFVPTTAKKAVGQIRFDIYLNKMLKATYQDSGITGEAMDELNSVVFLVGKAIADKASRVASQMGKKTINQGDVQVAAGLVLMRCQEIWSKVSKRLEKDEETWIPAARAKRFFKSSSKKQKYIGITGMRLSASATVLMARALDGFAAYIVQCLVGIADAHKKARVTSRHINLAFAGKNSHKNSELCALAKALNFSVGVSDKKIKYEKPKSLAEGGIKRKAGAKAKVEVNRAMKASNLVIPRASFKNYVKAHLGAQSRIQGGAAVALQEFIEARIVDILTQAYLVATHSQRQTLMEKDVVLALSMIQGGGC